MGSLTKNPLYLEHLNEGEKGIVACLDTYLETGKDKHWAREVLLRPSFFEKDFGYFEDIDYFGESKDWDKLGIKYVGAGPYVISSINGRDKLTRHLYDCTCIIGVGKDKLTWENISFLTHQDPLEFLPKERFRHQFTSDLLETLRSLKKRCVEGTIDIIITGGHYFLDDPTIPWSWEETRNTRASYKKSILMISKMVRKVFGFEPIVITGPKNKDRSDAVLFVNNFRHLYILRPAVGDATSESYLPRDFKDKEKKW